MELICVLIIIIIVSLLKQRKYKQYVYDLSTPKRNIPIQYAYTLDEWYDCRRKFDAIIQEDWELYRNGKISDFEYKDKCDAAVRKIIPLEYQPGFKTLYEWGVREAAVRIAQKGLAPGISEDFHLCNKDLPEFDPKEYARNGLFGMNSWMKCIPGPHSFLDSIPNPKYLEYMGCGVAKNGIWEPIVRPEECAGIYYSVFGNASNFEPDREEAIGFFVSRGYDGVSYYGDKRRFGNLTKEEIDKKYQFIVKQAHYNLPEHSATCKLVRDPNRILEEMMEDQTRRDRELQEGKQRLKELNKNG